MTNMKRTSVSLTDELVEGIARLKLKEEFKGCSESEIIRRLLSRGLEKDDEGRG